MTHTIERDHSKLITAVSGGSPKILYLKSLLETGAAILTDPYPRPMAKPRTNRE